MYIGVGKTTYRCGCVAVYKTRKRLCKGEAKDVSIVKLFLHYTQTV